MSQLEVTPETFTADYVGEPGTRTFYVQSQGSGATLTYLIEKQQVAALAERLRDLLMMIDEQDTIRSAAPARDPALVIAPPLEPEWRVGTMGLAFEEEADRVVVLMQPAAEGDEDEAEAIEDDDTGVRFLLRRDQVRAFVLHVTAVVQEGRPICQLCGLPMDPSGHICPASNGHHLST
ncbi:MAG: DUF3090 family protein [Actinomycetota bacterium]